MGGYLYILSQRKHKLVAAGHLTQMSFSLRFLFIIQIMCVVQLIYKFQTKCSFKDSCLIHQALICPMNRATTQICPCGLSVSEFKLKRDQMICTILHPAGYEGVVKT